MIPMLAQAVDIEKIQKYINQGYVMEPKLDGVRCVAEKRDGLVELTTRTGKSLTYKLPKIVEELQQVEGDWIIDGEVGYDNVYREDFGGWPILDFNATMRVLGSDPDTAVAKARANFNQGMGWPHYHVFDMLKEPSSCGDLLDEPDTFRRAKLDEFCRQYPFSRIFLVQRTLWINLKVYDVFCAAGGEGIMIKNPQGVYLPGKRRANTWYKLKKYMTADVVIMGFEPGQGKYSHMIGAIVCGVYTKSGELVEVCKCSGMDDSMRLHFSMHQEVSIGTVIELKYFGYVGQNSEGLRFPQFQNVRIDKEAHECLASQFEVC